MTLKHEVEEYIRGGQMTDTINKPKDTYSNKQALAELRLCAIVLRATQPSTVLNSLDLARKALANAIDDLAAVVQASER